jgi:hypothetical protein
LYEVFTESLYNRIVFTLAGLCWTVTVNKKQYFSLARVNLSTGKVMTDGTEEMPVLQQRCNRVPGVWVLLGIRL